MASEEQKTKQVRIDRAFTWQGQTYIPDASNGGVVEVPADFPEERVRPLKGGKGMRPADPGSIEAGGEVNFAASGGVRPGTSGSGVALEDAGPDAGISVDGAVTMTRGEGGDLGATVRQPVGGTGTFPVGEDSPTRPRAGAPATKTAAKKSAAKKSAGADDGEGDEEGGYEGMSRTELEDEIARRVKNGREINPTRADGEEGDPLVSDLRAALEADDQAK